MAGLLGRKLGMTQLFTDAGEVVPVTAVRVGPCMVTRKRSKDNDGYTAVQLGFEEVQDKKLSKPKRGYFSKQGLQKHYRVLREFRLNEEATVDVGAELTASLLKVGDMVNVSGITKGKGFQGVIKRHGKAGGPASHGSDFHRRTGSIGMRTWPARVLKNTRLPGHMGVDRITVKNLEVVAIEVPEHMVLLRGAVPGARGALIEVVSQDPKFLNRLVKAEANS